MGETTTYGRPFVVSIKMEGIGIIVGSGVVLVGEVEFGSRGSIRHIKCELLLASNDQKLKQAEKIVKSYIIWCERQW